MLKQALAKILKRLREEKKLSQDEFAHRAEVHRTYISQLERGLKSPTLDTLTLICGVLEIRLSELLRLVEEEMAAMAHNK